MRHHSIAFSLLVAILAICSFGAVQVVRLTDRIHFPNKGHTHMQTISQVVTTASGDQVTITTTRGPDEPVDVWLARHTEAVTAARQL